MQSILSHWVEHCRNASRTTSDRGAVPYNCCGLAIAQTQFDCRTEFSGAGEAGSQSKQHHNWQCLVLATKTSSLVVQSQAR